ncbi:MAG: sigma-70 family RNA polymerase sigma factor [Leptolyngbya sp. SIO4C1]|nr:sigma-70 family RNA polymerase sigma factor [Leptolyngbya sp. SIO4C1]
MPNSPNLPSLDVLDIALLEVLEKGNSYAYSTIATVRRHLYSFRLHQLIEPHEILFEAYLRGKETQRRGEEIRNAHAWLKRTAFNIVREKSRKARQQNHLQFEDLEYCLGAPGSDLLDQLNLAYEIQLLYEALQEFAQEDSYTEQLLRWRLIEQLSWPEICDRLAASGEEVPSSAALRQRVSRAKKRIRNILHGLGLPTV